MSLFRELSKFFLTLLFSLTEKVILLHKMSASAFQAHYVVYVSVFIVQVLPAYYMCICLTIVYCSNILMICEHAVWAR